jgi:adenylate cyclase class 2
MAHLNVEIKAACADQDAVRAYLKTHNADFKGTDHQIDTYFKVPVGRLKLREGTIENYLVFYERDETEGLKESKVTLYPFDPASALKSILARTHETLAIVDKQREIYFIDNVKFHIDTVEGLGTFVEIEARDPEGTIGRDTLHEQCARYLKAFGISDTDLIQGSYSDLVRKK